MRLRRKAVIYKKSLGEQYIKSSFLKIYFDLFQVFFSNEKFEDLNICETTKSSIKEMGFTFMTHIQSRTIPHLLKGRDLLGAAKTGSGSSV